MPRALFAGTLRLEALKAILTQKGFGAFLAAPGNELKLKQWIARGNVKKQAAAGIVVPATRMPRVAEVECNVDSFRVDSLDALLKEAMHTRLRVLPGAVLRGARYFVPFTCRGMLLALQSYRHEELLLGVDAKVGKGSKSCRIATLGLLVKENLTRSSFKRDSSGNCIRILAYTTTFKPILQALMNWETDDNYCDFMNVFLNLCAITLGISEDFLRTHCVLMAKDFNQSSENARAQVMPHARPLVMPPDGHLPWNRLLHHDIVLPQSTRIGNVLPRWHIR